jgi:hypothetical protein
VALLDVLAALRGALLPAAEMLVIERKRGARLIGLDIGEVESGAFWVKFLRSLKTRGLDGVRFGCPISARGSGQR